MLKPQVFAHKYRHILQKKWKYFVNEIGVVCFSLTILYYMRPDNVKVYDFGANVNTKALLE